ncbi:hypothetical protein BDC45DRAFT_497613 [Circinella umbellata]|nr:hypothetical protein BDC45DRAFT_497613 [Circinella umbellata]
MTKSVPSMLLDEAAIGVLYTNFENMRQNLVCPGTKSKCKQTGTIRLHGKNESQTPSQPQFRCHKCKGIFNASTMQQLLKNISVSTNTDMDFMDELSIFDSQPEQMNFIIKELQSQRIQLKQHQTQFDELAQLREELTRARQHITDLEETNRQLKEQLKEQSQKEGNILIHDTEFPPLSNRTPLPPSQNSTASKWAQLPRPKYTEQQLSPEKKQRRIAAAARIFQQPSDTHGFQYLYFFSKARMPVGRMRASLRQFGVDNSRVLDIQYPARQTIGLLVHNDFTESILQTLKEAGIHPIDFDPLDPKYVHDPKYSDASQDTRANIAHELQCARALRAIHYIRAPIKYAVARDFQNKGWISIEELKSILATKWRHPDDNANIVQNFQPEEEEDLLMDYEHTRPHLKRTITDRSASPSN